MQGKQNKQVKQVKDLQYEILKKEDIDESAKLIAKIFSKYDPFIVLLKIKEEELLPVIKQDLEKHIVSKLAMVVKEPDTKRIIGCVLGIKLSLFSLKEKVKNEIVIDLNQLDTMTKEQKLEILDDIDSSLIEASYKDHLRYEELDKSVFCDYFCISDDYFNTNLAERLISNYYYYIWSNNLIHIYGSCFNQKTIHLTSKLTNPEISKIIKIKFIKDNKLFKEFDVTMLHIYKDNIKPKF